MSVKTFCDGCGKQLIEHQVALIAESQLGMILAYSGGETEFHWCADCAKAIMKFTQTRRSESGT